MILVLTFLLALAATGLTQFPPIIIRPGVPFDNVQNMLLTNPIDTKPIVNIRTNFPICNEQHRFCNNKQDESEKVRNPVISGNQISEKPISSQDILHLRSELDQLNLQAKQFYTDKLKQLDELNKLKEDLKSTLQKTNILQNGLYAHEQQLLKLWQTMKTKSKFFAVDHAIVKELVKTMERLEKLVEDMINGFNQWKNKVDQNIMS